MAAKKEPPEIHPPLPPPSDPRRRTSLYVGDLHPDVTELDLMQLFCAVGPLTSVRFCRDGLPKTSLSYAYMNFLSPTDASKALDMLNHTELKGKSIRIMWFQRDPITRQTGNNANLFVQNLDPTITSSHLHGLFGKFGTILSSKVAEENGKSKGFGFVQFDLENSALAALNALHGSTIEGKKLCVSKFIKRSERKDANEAPNYTNLYVKNLDDSLTEELLQEKFQEYGKVCNAVIMKDGDGKSKGFGFVAFQSHQEAKNAVESLNGALFGSKNLFVGRAQRKSEREKLLKVECEEFLRSHAQDSNLYVRNLDPSTDDRNLAECFGTFGKIISAKVMRHDNGASKGFGFVSFLNPEEAKNALVHFNGTLVKGRPLYVAVAQKKEERRMQLQSIRAKYWPPHSLYFPNCHFLSQFHQQHCSSPHSLLNTSTHVPTGQSQCIPTHVWPYQRQYIFRRR